MLFLNSFLSLLAVPSGMSWVESGGNMPPKAAIDGTTGPGCGGAAACRCCCRGWAAAGGGGGCPAAAAAGGGVGGGGEGGA